MKRRIVLVLCALSFCVVAANGADKKKAEAISAYCHVCEAASRISLELVGMLAKYPYESPMVKYAAKIADVNTSVFENATVPAGAESVHEHFGKAVAAFEKAVKLHHQAEYKASKEAARKCTTEFVRAVAEVKKLRKEGVIP